MTEPSQVLALFSSIHETLKMEDRLDAAKIPFRSVVKPRKLGTDCGIGISLDESRIPELRTIVQDAKARLIGIYRRNGDEYHLVDFQP